MTAPAAISRRRLGSSAVEVTALGLGAAPLGNLYQRVTDEQAAATVRATLDGGVRYIDVAPHYGAGLAERRLGQVLPGCARGTFTISTKVGRLLRAPRPDERPESYEFDGAPLMMRDWDFSGEGIRRSLASSLERLGLERVDIALLHDPDKHREAVYGHAYAALAELRDRGEVGAIGAGMNQTAMLTDLVRGLDLDVVLCAGRYTLLDPSAAHDLLPACVERGTSVVVGGVYNSGLLADPRPGARYDYAAAPPDLLARARAIAKVCAGHDVPLRAAALRFPFGHPAVASVVIGCRSAAEVEDNLAMFHHPIPDELWHELRHAGLIPTDVPVPWNER